MDRTIIAALSLEFIRSNIHLDMASNPAYAHMAPLSAFIDLVPDDYASEVRLAHTKRIDTLLWPEEGLDLISGVVTMGDVTFTTLLSLASGVYATSRFNCRALPDTGSPQSFIHQGFLTKG